MFHFTSSGDCGLFYWSATNHVSMVELSHSEILGLMPVCGSPRLIATYYVLHRLSAPRHSPPALTSLIKSNIDAVDCDSTDHHV
jgi:hypothetical protein